MPPNLRGALLALAGFGLFSAGDVMVKFLGQGFSPVQIVAFVCLFTLPMIGLHWLKSPVSIRPVHPWLMALRTLALIGNGLLITYSFTVLPLAQVYAIAFTLPVLITLLAWPILGDRVNLAGGFAVLLGLVGVIVALQPGQVTMGPGHFAAAIGVVMAAIHYIIIRKTGGVEAMVPMLLYPVLGQAIVALALLPGRFQPMSIFDISLVAGIALAAFVATLLMIAAYRAAPPIIVAPTQYSQIIWAAVLGAAFFGEHMSANTVLGMVLIAMAGLVIVARPGRPVADNPN